MKVTIKGDPLKKNMNYELDKNVIFDKYFCCLLQRKKFDTLSSFHYTL